MSKSKLTPEGILDLVKESIEAHEPESGFLQWYVDELSIDCDADEFWTVVEVAIKEALSTVGETEQQEAK